MYNHDEQHMIMVIGLYSHDNVPAHYQKLENIQEKLNFHPL